MSHRERALRRVTARAVLLLASLVVVALAGCVGWSTPIGGVGLEMDARYYTPYPLAYANAFAHLKVPDLSVSFQNHLSDPVEVRVTSSYPGYSQETVSQVTVPADSEHVVDQVISLDWDRISTIQSSTKLPLSFQVQSWSDGAWVDEWQDTEYVDAYPQDVAVFWVKADNGAWEPMYSYVGVFVTPHSPGVQELLSIARDYHPAGTLSGTQCAGCTDDEWLQYTTDQVVAIYDALQDHYGVSYVNMASGFNSDTTSSQRVLLPDDTLRLGSANCLDGTFLFASALEAIGINPYVVIVPGHAYLAWDWKPGEDSVSALETTMVGHASFDWAAEVGHDRFTEDLDKLNDLDNMSYGMWDIKAMRGLGIHPSPTT